MDAYARKDHNPENFSKLAKAIRKVVGEHHRTRNGTVEEQVALPEYPKTEVRERRVIIIYEDGEEQLWSEEPDEVKAYQVAEEIQFGLRMRHYVTDKLRRHMDNISDSLLDMNVPLEEIEDIVFEGYRSLAKYFEMLRQSSD